jgi:predicted transcriptional regulator of viral defense system
MLTSGGYYDQLKITAASSGVNGQIDRLVLSNLYSKGGGCVLDRIKAGTLEIILNEVGAGDGFDTKDFQIATSVIYKSFENDDNVEVSISPPS